MPRNRLAAILATTSLVVAAVAVTAVTAGPAKAASATAVAPGPEIKLVPAQSTITVSSFGKTTYLDPGVWIASLGAPLQFDVSRPSYTKPLTITQVLGAPGGTQVARPLPASVLDGWNGLKDFIHLTVVNAKGKLVGDRTLTFCPDSYAPERATDGGPLTSPYPASCGTFDPFPLGEVWGIAQDWAADPIGGSVSPPAFTIPLGTYKVTVSITRLWAGLLKIPAANTSVTVTANVVKGTNCCTPNGCCGPAVPASFVGKGQAKASSPRALPELPASVPTMTSPPASVLPDLVPLPSWGIAAAHSGKKDLLSFGATVWIGGNAPLDVEGFRQNGSPVMPAYQYFFDSSGQVVGRAPAGTMGFDAKPGHDHWHFQQFAEYQLLGANKQLVVRSSKVGFCIAPTDQVDLTLTAAAWQPPSIGFAGGECGSPTALWVREQLPVGWGDTYEQFVAGQAFDITSLKNGTYYIEIIANPDHVLHETDTGNDVSLRKIIISGTAGHRHVTVPAWNRIDPEG